MKIQVSLSAIRKKEFEKGDRVICKVDANEWYVGTVRSAGAKLKIDFDDGADATIGPEDFRDVMRVNAHKNYPKPMTDIQAIRLRDGVTDPYKQNIRAPQNLLAPLSSIGMTEHHEFNVTNIFDATEAGIISGEVVKIDLRKYLKKIIPILDKARRDIEENGIDGIQIGMKYIDSHKIAEYVKRFKRGEKSPLAYSVMEGTEPALIDGNHRAIAAYVSGLSHIDAYAWKLSDLLRIKYNKKNLKNNFLARAN